jgi:hypothetical protein
LEYHSPSSFIHQYPVNWLFWEELPWNGSGKPTCVKPVHLPLLCCQKSIARKSEWKPTTRRFSLHFAGQISRQDSPSATTCSRKSTPVALAARCMSSASGPLEGSIEDITPGGGSTPYALAADRRIGQSSSIPSRYRSRKRPTAWSARSRCPGSSIRVAEQPPRQQRGQRCRSNSF